MPVEKIVLNTSPLILLCNGELDFILPELFVEIIVPVAVWQEVVDGSHLDRAAQMLSGLAWLRKESVTPVPDAGFPIGTPAPAFQLAGLYGETLTLGAALFHGGRTDLRLISRLVRWCWNVWWQF